MAARVTVDIDAQSLDSPLDSYLRIFYASGTPIEKNDDADGLDPPIALNLSPGTYYVGVSSYANRTYDPTLVDSRFPGSTGAYTIKITASAPTITWDPVVTVTATYDGNPDPAVFGRYLVGSGVPPVSNMFTADVAPVTGFETKQVTFDCNFNDRPDAEDCTDSTPNDGWSWTRNVSSLTGDQTFKVWAQESGGTWSSATTFTIDTLAAPEWINAGTPHKVEWTGSGYHIESLMTQNVIPELAVPDWPFIDKIASKLGVSTIFELEFGVRAVADLGLASDLPRGSVQILLLPAIFGDRIPIPLTPPLSVRPGSAEATTSLPEVDDLFQYSTWGGFRAWHVSVPIADLGDLIAKLAGKSNVNSVLQWFTSKTILPAGRGRPRTESDWNLNLDVSVADGGYLDQDLHWRSFGLEWEIGLAAAVTRNKQPQRLVDVPLPSIPVWLAPPIWVKSNVGVNLTFSGGGDVQISDAGVVAADLNHVSVTPELVLSVAAELEAPGLVGAGVKGSAGVGIEATFGILPGGPWFDTLDVTLIGQGSLSVFGELLGAEFSWEFAHLEGRLKPWHWDFRAPAASSSLVGSIEAQSLGDDEASYSAAMQAPGPPEPVLLPVGGQTLLLFQANDGSGVSQVWSQWRDTDGNWESPSAVTSGSNYHGRLAAATLPDSNVYSVWLQSRQAQSSYDPADENAFLSDLEVVGSRWDGTAWSDPAVVGAGTGPKGKVATGFGSIGGSTRGLTLWEEGSGSLPDDLSLTRIQWATWSDQGWTAMGPLGPLDEMAWGPSVAFDNFGHAVATWLAGTLEAPLLRWAFWDGTNWSPPGLLPATPGARVEYASVYRHADGGAFAVWVEAGSEWMSLRASTWDFSLQAWGPVEAVLQDEVLIDRPVVAISPEGRVTIAFHGRGYTDDLLAYTKDYATLGSLWTPEQNLTGTGYVEWMPAVAYANNAQLVVRYVSEDVFASLATTRAGGIYLHDATDVSLSIDDCIVAQNSAPTAPDVSGTVTSRGYNIVGDGSGSAGWHPTDKVGTPANPIDPKLGALADNGGPTFTHAPLPGSPAIDWGINEGAPETDQRGFPRPQDGNADGDFVVDVGAVELLLGDFDHDRALGLGDVNRLIGAIVGGEDPPEFDLIGDGKVDFADLVIWVKDLKKTWFGDANLDGEFNTKDLIQVLQCGTYEQHVDAGWECGDWNGDRRFTSADIVIALQDGGYERGPRQPVAAVRAGDSTVQEDNADSHRNELALLALLDDDKLRTDRFVRAFGTGARSGVKSRVAGHWPAVAYDEWAQAARLESSARKRTSLDVLALDTIFSGSREFVPYQRWRMPLDQFPDGLPVEGEARDKATPRCLLANWRSRMASVHRTTSSASLDRGVRP